MNQPIDVSVCGAVGVAGRSGEVTAVHGLQPSVVLAALALEHGRLRHETIADIVWGDRIGEHWSGALRGLYSKVRRSLRDAGHDPAVLSNAHGTVGFDVPIRTEIDRVKELLDTIRRDPDDERIAETVGLSVALRQPLLPAHEGEWADSWRHHIEAVRRDVDHHLLDTMLGTGRVETALDHARRLVTADPVDETAHRRVIELLVSEGRRDAAREAFTAYEHMLMDEYGAEADPDLRRLVFGRRLGSVASPVLRMRAQHPHAHEPFVARRSEIERARTLWDEVVSTRTTRMLVLNGSSGIGKTRLADHLATTLPDANVLWGRSRQFAGHPFGPVADAITGLLDRDPAFAHDVEKRIPALSRLLSGATNPAVSPIDGAIGRQMAIDAARDLIGSIITRPTVLVLDDLQWAGLDGLAILTAIVSEVTGPLLLIVTRRVRTDDTTTALTAIQRTIPVDQIDLARFDPDELAELWSATRPSPPSSTDLDRFARQTAGLPYYASELLRGGSTGAGLLPDGDVPASVAEWVLGHRRLLPSTTRSVLDLIAVVGAPVDHQLLVDLTGHGDDETAGALDELTAAGLLRGRDDGTFEIPHDLTADAIYANLGRSSRALLHRRIGDHLDERGGTPGSTAHHWTFAGPAREQEALDAHRRAGLDAIRRGAWETARTHLEIVTGRADDPGLRTDALIGLGTASLHQGRHDEARDRLAEAADLARDHHLVHAVAKATLLLVGRAGRGAALVDDQVHASWLRDALRLLTGDTDRSPTDPEPDVDTTLLISRIERELALSILFEDRDESADLLTRSFERVQRLASPPAMDLGAASLALRAVDNEAADLHGRTAEIDRVLALPRPELGPEVTIAAHVYRHEDLLRMGRRAEAAQDLAIAKRHADRHGHAYWRWAISTWEALTAMLDGDFETAEALAAAAAADRSGVFEAAACLQVNRTAIRLLQDRAAEIVEPLEGAVELFPHIPTYRAVLALARSEVGDHEGARLLLEELEPDGFGALPEDSNRFLGLGVLAHVAADLGHERAATELYRILQPFAGLLVLVNCYGGGGAVWGPVSWALARLAPLAGHGSEAERWWTRAIRAIDTVPVLRERVLADAAAHEAA